MKWWEKTVEYYFLQRWVENSVMVAPLDGHHEKAGDMLASRNAKFIMIEFKKDLSCLVDEGKKFENYEYAKMMMEYRDCHHFMVYGQLTDDVSFELIARTYFSERVSLSFSEMTEAGLKIEEFNSYLKDFTKYKGAGGSGGGMLEVNDYQMVMGIITNVDRLQVVCMSLEEACSELALKVVAKPIKKQEPPQMAPPLPG